MSLYLAIMEGEPGKAEPLLATRDGSIIRMVVREITRRVEGANPRTLELVNSRTRRPDK